ncbi:MAG: OmpA family protein [Sphingobium sp.]|nr:OmpA family protein [Sphingobium sp.]
MPAISKRARNVILLAALTLPVSGTVLAQPQSTADNNINVIGSRTEGPEVKGIITARKGDLLQVTTADGNKTSIGVNEATKIKASSGLFGGRAKLGTADLLNGLPVSVKTYQMSDGSLVANQVNLKNSDYKTAAMIRNGTEQRFGEHDQHFAMNDADIAKNAAATEALRGRVGDIDNYIIKATTNVNFDTGRADLSPEAKNNLCQAAQTAETTNNALLLVVGYTDSTGSDEVNQALSEKRATKVINYLQQQCHWKPYRMLTPTGMATADPLADNSTPQGRAQNRRVAVNVLVSKAVEGLEASGS